MKKSELKQTIKEEILEILSEADQEDIDAQADLNKELEATKGHRDDLGDSLSEIEDEDDMDKQASKAAKKGDSVSKLASKLQQTTKEMKSVVKKWKNSDGSEKDKLTKRLKELTKIKKELEGLL